MPEPAAPLGSVLAATLTIIAPSLVHSIWLWGSGQSFLLPIVIANGAVGLCPSTSLGVTPKAYSSRWERW